MRNLWNKNIEIYMLNKETFSAMLWFDPSFLKKRIGAWSLVLRLQSIYSRIDRRGLLYTREAISEHDKEIYDF